MPDIWINADTLHQVLEELRLSETTFRYGVQEINRACRVLAFLQVAGERPRSVRQLSAFIAPIVCASRENQALFHVRFAELLARDSIRDGKAPPLLRQRTSDPDGTDAGAAAKSAELDHFREADRQGWRYPAGTEDATTNEPSPPSEADRKVVSGFWWTVALHCLLGALLVGGITFTLRSSGLVGLSDDRRVEGAAKTDEMQPEQSLPSRRHLLLGLSPFPVALFAIWWQRRRQGILRRRFTFRRFDEKEVRFGNPHDTHLDRRLMARTLPALRRTSRTGETVFDSHDSVSAAAAAGGRALPQFREVLRPLEFILLIRRAGAADHTTRVARDLAKLLQSAGVPVVVYEVLGIAELLRPLPDLSFGIVPLPGGPDDSVKLADALEAVPRAVALFFGDGRGLEAGSEAPQDSASALLATRDLRAILTPVPMGRWGVLEQSLEELDYAVLPADSAGIAALGDWVTDGSRNDIAPTTLKILQRNRKAETLEYRRFPRLLVSAGMRFLSRRSPPQEQIDKLLLQLKSYLGASAFAWLGALAVYPRVAADLTRELGRRLCLTPGRVLFSEQGYFALSQLPWVMRGSIPDWMRTALIGQMEVNFAKQVRQELRNLLMCPASSGRVELGIVDRSGAAWRDVWDRLLRDLPQHSDMREQVFLQFMFGNRLLSVPAPRILIRALMGFRRLLTVETLLALVCVILSITFLLKATPSIDQLGGKWAEWGWLVALPSVPVWNAWRLTQSNDELTVEGVIFGVLVVVVIAIEGAVQYAWIMLGLTIFLWLARWLRQRPLAVRPISLLAVIPVLLLMTVTVVVDPALVGSFLEAIGSSLQFAYLIFTLLGTLLAIRLAWQAFNRRLIVVAGVPTLSRYLTSPQQYRFGQVIFVIFASGFFLSLVYFSRELIQVVLDFQREPPEIVSDSPSYLLTTAGMGVVYLYLLTREAEWNVLLMVRDTIQHWMSIPQEAGQIVALLQFSMSVSDESVVEVLRQSTEVLARDFRRERNTLDRMWAETCYMNWWLTQGQRAGEDAVFFADPSFGFGELLKQFDKATARMGAWKAGQAVEVNYLVDRIKELHLKFSRLVACYLIYRNPSRDALRAEAKTFGIELRSPAGENPLRYWIVYALALTASVYVGVYGSAIAYDLMTGAGLNLAQDPERAQAWMMYSFSNYGVAIVAVLLLRLAGPYLGLGVHQSHLITYSYTFVVAFLTGPFGLAIATQLFGPARYQTMSLLEIFYTLFKWGLGPALVAVYISYYLDRQIYDDLPDINHSYATVGWRLLNCIGFAGMTVFLLLPSLLAVQAQPDAAWDTSKLRFVATGMTFFTAFGLALAAQFALRRGTEAATPVLVSRMN